MSINESERRAVFEDEELNARFVMLEARFVVLEGALASGLQDVESRLDAQFERRYSQSRALTVRLFASSIAANVIAVTTALAV